MKYIGFIVGFALLLGGSYGAAKGDWGGAPFIILGAGLIAYLLWTRNHRVEGE